MRGWRGHRLGRRWEVLALRRSTRNRARLPLVRTIAAAWLDNASVPFGEEPRVKTPHPPTAQADKLAYNVNEAAQALGVGRSTLYKLINDGALPSTTIGSRRLIFRQDLDEFVARERRRNARSEERR